MEERVRRHERILRHRYSKMLRRRALWERDASPRLFWPWKLPNRWLAGHVSDAQNLSSTPNARTKAEEHRNDSSRKDSPLTTFHRDFESFKKAVDRAIERDPYGTLFGRRLQSPPSANNSSWTSFSWIFDPKEIREGKDEPENTGSSSSSGRPARPTSTADSIPWAESYSSNASRIPISQSVTTDEYEYDPISMRKVPKTKPEFQSPLTQPPEPPNGRRRPSNASPPPKGEAVEPRNKTFFEQLFGEHGVDIPVKTYKPPKVYGYGAEVKKDKPVDEVKRAIDFETSKKHEIKALKAKTLGNTIDTTAEYGGKYIPKEDVTEPITPPKAHAAAGTTPGAQPATKLRDQSEPSDDTPLFSGTTYEGRLAQTPPSNQPKSAWLRKEGFSIEQTAPKKNDAAVQIPVKKSKSRIEPSLDRVQRLSETPVQPKTTKLEPALDRQHKSTASKASLLPSTTSLKAPASEKLEDVDLLRASDVRAAVRSARISKQEKAEHKSEARKMLENDFSTRQTQADISQPKSSDWGRATISKSIENVQNHVRQYPDGIVARTVKSMGMFNDNWKKYVRPEPKVDLNTPLEFKDESLGEVASIHKQRRKTSSSISFLPSKEVMEAERLSQQRSRDLQDSNVAAREKADEEAAKASELARNIRRAYETEYGRINVRHRQPQSEEQDQTQTPHSPEDKTKPHPLSTATVREGTPHYPVIESHIANFEPKFSNLVQDAKSLRKELHGARDHFRQLRKTMNQKPWAELETAGWEAAKAEPPPPQESEAASEKTSPAVQEPVFTPDGSSIWNDEHPPPISELKEAFTSPFVILKYNRETKSVSRLTAHFHEAAHHPTPSPLKILSRLQHAEKFYPYFSALEQANYEIITSNSDTLIFRKIGELSALREKVRGPARDAQRVEQAEARARAVAEQAAAQTVTQEITVELPQPSSTKPTSKEAATVLEEIPIDIAPSPGPSAPTAPASTPTSKPATEPVVTPVAPAPTSIPAGAPIAAPAATPTTPTAEPTTTPVITQKPKVKRQEEVFSGTRTSRPGPQITNPIDPETAAPYPSPSSERETADALPQASAFTRFFRTVKRVIYTAVTLGVGAYIVGVITEGLDAKTQQKSIASGNAGEVGPRKKVVMPVQQQQPEWTGRRAGIYSTESSR